MSRTVYLAGPILGCTEGEANDWRKGVSDVLKPHDIIGISPLRCEPIRGERYGTGNDDPRFGTALAIASKNLFDVLNTDMTIAYLPRPAPGREQSWGTIVEIAWAKAFNKPAIIVSDHEKVLTHPVVLSCAAWIVPTLLDAEDICIGILAGYVGGKNV